MRIGRRCDRERAHRGHPWCTEGVKGRTEGIHGARRAQLAGCATKEVRGGRPAWGRLPYVAGSRVHGAGCLMWQACVCVGPAALCGRFRPPFCGRFEQTCTTHSRHMYNSMFMCMFMFMWTCNIPRSDVRMRGPYVRDREPDAARIARDEGAPAAAERGVS